jgi:SulP family sulfate permease
VLTGPRNDVAILLITFLLTILVDLTAAIGIGMVLAAFLFMRKMIQSSAINLLTSQPDEEEGDPETSGQCMIPKGVDIFEISGPLFFGVTYKFRDTINLIAGNSKVLIIRMGHVPIIDATGIKTIKDLYNDSKRHQTKLILSEVNSKQVMTALKDARLLFAIGKANVTVSFEEALKRSRAVLMIP